LESTDGKQMQGVHLDPNSWESPNGGQFAKRRMTAPGTLCSMQWALGDRSSLMYMLPFRKDGLEVITWEHFDDILGQQQEDPL
jgi:hypothetical protein